jgi:formate dehydrogenase gamma subunit
MATWMRFGGACVALALALCRLSAEELKDSGCMDCHADRTLTKTNAAGREISLFVDEAKLRASVHKTNTCVSCHADITSKHPDDEVPAKRVDCGRCHVEQTQSYGGSVHGRALAAGRADAATCQDCHDQHEVLPPTSPQSPLHFSRQAETCGQCHPQEAADVAASVHGQAAARGVRDAPTCTDCHWEHEIQALKEGKPRKIAEEVCSRCHASERLNTKYHLPPDRVKTFFESYHGLASRYGSTVAANCASCHGYHKVLPSSDPDSTIHPSRLVETCGKCHPGATAKFAQSKVHVDVSGVAVGPDWGSRINWWVRRIYLTLIVVVVGSMLAHNALVFVKKAAARLRRAERPILRMDRVQRWQHGVLAVSFIVLAVTGFALKFPDSWVAWMLGSSEPLRRWAHRIAGVVLLGVGFYHLIYIVASANGRRLVRDLMPSRRDVADVVAAARYWSGLSREKPKFGRFGYAEKTEYWSVVWGTIIMGVTGLMVWFKMEVTQWLPRWTVDVALTIHFYEAVLACLAIAVWHLYHVMFDPDVYPVNPAFWDGRVSRHWMEEEHSLDESLRQASPTGSETNPGSKFGQAGGGAPPPDAVATPVAARGAPSLTNQSDSGSERRV